MIEMLVAAVSQVRVWCLCVEAAAEARKHYDDSIEMGIMHALCAWV